MNVFAPKKKKKTKNKKKTNSLYHLMTNTFVAAEHKII